MRSIHSMHAFDRPVVARNHPIDAFDPFD